VRCGWCPRWYPRCLVLGLGGGDDGPLVCRACHPYDRVLAMLVGYEAYTWLGLVELGRMDGCGYQFREVFFEAPETPAPGVPDVSGW